MSKRIKHVVPTEEVAHLWMHKAQSDARNGSNFYFEGDTIYSYGSHFPIARHVTSKSGRKHAILFTTRGYSVTTSKHIGIVRVAIQGNNVPVFHVEHPEYEVSGSSNTERYVAGIVEAIAKQSKARSTYRIQGYFEEARSLKAECKAYCEFFGLKNPKFPKLLALPADFEGRQEREKQRNEERQERERVQREAQAKAWAEQNAAVISKYKDDLAIWETNREAHIANWMAGDSLDLPTRPYTHYAFRDDGIYVPELPKLPTMLRIVGDDVETSQHATFPMAHAKRGLALVRSVMARGTDWQTNGHTCHLGPYKIDKITAEGTVFAGCHVVPWESIERIAPALDAI